MGKRIQLELAHPDSRREFYLIDIPRNNLYIGSHPDNDLVIAHEGIGPYHIVLDLHRQPYRVTVLAEQGEVRGGGSPLPPGKSHPLPADADIEVAGHRIAIVEQRDTRAAGNTRTAIQVPRPASPDLTGGAAGTQPEIPVSTDLHPREAAVKVDERTTFRLTVRNDGAATSIFSIHIRGMHSSWVTLPDRTVTVPAGSERTLPLDVTVPRLPGSQAGRHRLVVEISSPDIPDWQQQAAFWVAIDRFYRFSLSPIAPREQMLPRFGRTAIVNLSLTNQGNSPVTYLVQASDREEGCHFAFLLPGHSEPATERVEVHLQGGETLPIPVRVRPPRRPLAGFTGQTHHFAISVTSLTGAPAQRTEEGRIGSRPVAGPITIVTALLCLVLGLNYFLPYQTGDIARSLPLFAEQAPEPEASPAPLEGTPLAQTLPAGPQAAARPMTYEEMFKELGERYELDWRMLAAVAYHESGLDPAAVGRDNDMGLMQIMPATWEQVAPTAGVSDPFDPYSNATVGAAFLAFLEQYCHDLGYRDQRWVLAAYNWGPANIRRLSERDGNWSEVPEQTQIYAARILEDARKLPPPRWMEEAAQQVVERPEP